MSSALKDGCLNLYLLPRVQLQKKTPNNPTQKKPKQTPPKTPPNKKKSPNKKNQP